MLDKSIERTAIQAPVFPIAQGCAELGHEVVVNGLAINFDSLDEASYSPDDMPSFADASFHAL